MARKKATTPEAPPARDPSTIGKIDASGVDPVIAGTDVLVESVIIALEDGASEGEICDVQGILRADIDCCKAWMQLSEEGREIATKTSALYEPSTAPQVSPLVSTPISARKCEMSRIVPGGIVLERMQRTLPVSLTEAELATKRQEVYTAARTIRDAEAEQTRIKARIKSVSEHQRTVLSIIDCGQEERSVECELVLDGTVAKLYRLDRTECIETRPATQHERQLMLAE